MTLLRPSSHSLAKANELRTERLCDNCKCKIEHLCQCEDCAGMVFTANNCHACRAMHNAVMNRQFFVDAQRADNAKRIAALKRMGLEGE